jgi:hypothetical protein
MVCTIFSDHAIDFRADAAGAIRLVSQMRFDIATVVRTIGARLVVGRPTLVAIDGRSGVGKSMNRRAAWHRFDWSAFDGNRDLVLDAK